MNKIASYCNFASWSPDGLYINLLSVSRVYFQLLCSLYYTFWFILCVLSSGFYNFWFHRTTAWLGLKGSSRGHVVQSSCYSRFTQNRLHLQTDFEYVQRRRLHSISGQSTPVLWHHQRKEVFPHVQIAFPVFQFVLIVPCSVAGHHWKGFAPILLTPALKIFLCIDKIFSQHSLLQAGQAQPPQSFFITKML